MIRLYWLMGQQDRYRGTAQSLETAWEMPPTGGAYLSDQITTGGIRRYRRGPA